ncbi:MAG: hypothetical protein HY791_33410 [Deltaproteobacteria bacterium]|nr:hypothetical protein [Deltaproteobacteria bacterium]
MGTIEGRSHVALIERPHEVDGLQWDPFQPSSAGAVENIFEDRWSSRRPGAISAQACVGLVFHPMMAPLNELLPLWLFALAMLLRHLPKILGWSVQTKEEIEALRKRLRDDLDGRIARLVAKGEFPGEMDRRQLSIPEEAPGGCDEVKIIGVLPVWAELVLPLEVPRDVAEPRAQVLARALFGSAGLEPAPRPTSLLASAGDLTIRCESSVRPDDRDRTLATLCRFWKAYSVRGEKSAIDDLISAMSEGAQSLRHAAFQSLLQAAKQRDLTLEASRERSGSRPLIFRVWQAFVYEERLRQRELSESSSELAEAPQTFELEGRELDAISFLGEVALNRGSCQEADEELRVEVIRVLVHLGAIRAIRAVVMADPPVAMTAELLRALGSGNLGREPAERWIVEGPTEQVVSAAAEVLSRVGTLDSLDALYEARSRCGSAALRSEIDSAIGSIRREFAGTPGSLAIADLPGGELSEGNSGGLAIPAERSNRS